MRIWVNKVKYIFSITLILLFMVSIPCSSQEVAFTNGYYPIFKDVIPTLTTSEGISLDSFAKESPTATAHKVLGYMTVACGLLTGILNPDNVGEGLHEMLGYTSAGLAGATLGFGFLSHMDKVGVSNGMSANNIHMVLGIAGGTMMLITPLVAPGDTHKILGELGALTMGVSVVAKLVL